MNTSLLFVTALVFLFATSAPLLAQGSEESAGRATEQAGKPREALTHYVAALQSAPDGSADDQRLRETIIKLVQKLSLPPAIPEEARRYSVRGQVWVKEAKSPSDFDEAAKEFGKALRVAPWWADGYINQGVSLEKAGKFNEAIRSLKLYLLAAPRASDADKVKDQIYTLELRQEKAQRDAVAAREEQERKRREEEAKASDPARLAGEWCGDMIKGKVSCGNEYKTRISGTTIEFSMYPWHNRWVVIFRGEVRGNKIEGVNITYDGGGTSDCSATTPMTGTVINDNRIELDYDGVSVYSTRNTCYTHERQPARKVFIRRPSG